MAEDPIVAAVRGAVWLTLQMAGPALLVMLVVGLVIALLQALTQVQEPTLAFLPKAVALIVVLLLLGPGMAGALRGYAAQLFDQVVAVGGLP